MNKEINNDAPYRANPLFKHFNNVLCHMIDEAMTSQLAFCILFIRMQIIELTIMKIAKYIFVYISIISSQLMLWP